ncbi:MAG: heparinase II/III family protein, partial [Bryobacteraceae bacterium]
DSGYAGVPMTAHHNTMLIDGKGQAKEGAGHNAFNGVPYSRLDQIRIVKVEPQKDGVAVVADPAAAYEPKFGLKKFLRTFHVTRSSVSIVDQISASEPHVYSTVIHFDGPEKPDGLKLEVLEPKGAVTQLEPNRLTAPGPPGSVDKGPKEIRGSRLVVSTPSAVRDAQFRVTLSF